MDYSFPLLAVLIWGGNVVVTKLSVGVISPIEISFYRWFLAVIAMTPFAFSGVKQHLGAIKANAYRLAVLGVVGGVVYQSLAYYAAHYTTATNMGIIQAMMPIIVLLLSTVIFKTRLGIAPAVGALVSAVGVVFVVTNGNFAALLRNGLNWGDVLMLMGTLALSIYNLLLQKWRMPIPLLQSVYIQAIVATLALAPLFLFEEKHSITMSSAAFVLYAGIAASILAPMTWMKGVEKLGAARVAMFFNLLPLVTTAGATVVLSEELSFAVQVGAFLAIAGVVIGEFRRQ
jgi:drug/metabolite transporter (DMT)-like permease